jgi:chromosome segregation ATPase
MLLQEEVKRMSAELEKAQKTQTDAEQYKDDLDQLKTRYDQTLSEATQRWEELKGIRSENTKRKKDLDTAQATTQRLQGELLTKQTELDRIVTLREELATIKNDRDRLQEALKVRDEDVTWLRSHVAQLTQQLALPPSEEEAKAKHWYQFWK